MFNVEKSIPETPLTPKRASTDVDLEGKSASLTGLESLVDGQKRLQANNFAALMSGISQASSNAEMDIQLDTETPSLSPDNIDIEWPNNNPLVTLPPVINMPDFEVDMPDFEVDMPDLEHGYHPRDIGLSIQDVDIEKPIIGHDRETPLEPAVNTELLRIDIPLIRANSLDPLSSSIVTPMNLSMHDIEHESRSVLEETNEVSPGIDMPLIAHDSAQPLNAQTDINSHEPSVSIGVDILTNEAHLSPALVSTINKTGPSNLSGAIAGAETLQQTAAITDPTLNYSATPSSIEPESAQGEIPSSKAEANKLTLTDQKISPEPIPNHPTAPTHSAAPNQSNVLTSQSGAISIANMVAVTPETPSSTPSRISAAIDDTTLSSDKNIDLKSEFSRLEGKVVEEKLIADSNKTALTSQFGSIMSSTSATTGPSLLTPASLAPSNPTTYTMAPPNSPLLQIAGQAQIMSNVNEISQNLVRAVESQKGISVRLDPPEMGRVYIDFQFDGERNISAVLRADVPDMMSHLRDNAAVLQSLLKESGFEGVALDFSDQTSDSASFEQNQNDDTEQGLSGINSYNFAVNTDPTTRSINRTGPWTEQETIDIRL